VTLSTSSIIWTMSDRTPPPWDPSDHLRYGYDYYKLLGTLDFKGFSHEFFDSPHFYAPLVHLVTAGLFLAFRASRLSGLGVNLISLALLLASVYSIARRQFGPVADNNSTGSSAGHPAVSRSTATLGVLAAMIAACTHFSGWLMHDAFLDFPLTAAVAGAMALLIRAEDFQSRRNALQFALAAGLGLLVKQTFAFFFLLPAIYVTGRVLLSRDRRKIANLLLAGLVILAIAAIWYGPHFEDVLSIYRENRRAAVDENEAPLLSFDSNFFYVHALISFQLQLPFAILMVIGLIYSAFRLRRQSALIYLWLLSGLAVFALVANKDVRYTVPLAPAAALFAVCWLRPLFAGRWRGSLVIARGLALGIAGWALVSFFNAQWPRPGFGTAINTPRYQWMVFARNYYGFDHRPLREDWSVPSVVDTVASLGVPAGDFPPQPEPAGQQPRATSPKQGASPAEAARNSTGSQPTLGVVVNLPYLNPSGVALYARLMAGGRPVEPLVRVRWLVIDGSLASLDECDYVLVRTGLDQAEWVAAIEREFEDLLRRQPERFSRVASFPLPLKAAEALVYRVNKLR
jgi:4-amino-4-deoxy-L-arabinose transferase-like glycosyltransferase